ncbi:MAG: HAMP domain-containing histidine kinase [Polyangiaceae bacterium]|nr:HAMP domain-containing histidine kinase [Polyangiaceae bacterium]
MNGDLSRSVIRWLVGLRWAVVVVLAGSVIASPTLLELPISLPFTLGALALLVAVNLAHRHIEAWLPPRVETHWLLMNVAFDVVAIAVVLAATGGAANPFSSILLVYVALGASLLPARSTFALAGLAACTFGALFLVPRPTTACGHPVETAFSNHLYGMWAAFVLGACLVAVFVTRIRRAVEERERELHALRTQAERADKFAALGTLAAGAAHELGTPLGTIHVLAGELEAQASSAESAEQARAIATQIERCRAILQRMRPGRGLEEVGVSDLGSSVSAAVASWRAAHPGTLVEVVEAPAANVPVGPSEIEAALTVLLDNALRATPSSEAPAPIVVRAGRRDGALFIAVEDEGIGVQDDTMRRMGEPFFTTRAPGQGLGLGLFVVRTLLQQVGGRLEVEQRSPRGTCVRLCFGAQEPERYAAGSSHELAHV